jgi:hypothetical protein
VVAVGVRALMVNESVPVEPASLLPDPGVNTALRSSVPTGRAVVEVDAVPAETATGPPNRVGVPEPYSNCTVPEAAGLTLAFNVSDVPTNCGLVGEAVSVVVVGVASISKVAVPVEPE